MGNRKKMNCLISLIMMSLTSFLLSSCGDSMGKTMGQEAKVEIKKDEVTMTGLDEALATYDASTAAATAKYQAALTQSNTTLTTEMFAAGTSSAALTTAIAKQQTAAAAAAATFKTDIAAIDATFFATVVTITVPATETGGQCSATSVKLTHPQFSIDFGDIDAGDTKTGTTTLTVAQLSQMDEAEPSTSFATGSCKGTTGTGVL